MEIQTSPSSSMSDEQRHLIGRTIWDWNDCGNYKGDHSHRTHCSSRICATDLLEKLASFFGFYQSEVAVYGLEKSRNAHAALSTHKELCELIKTIKANPSLVKTELGKQAFPDKDDGAVTPFDEQERAINLAANLITMTSCMGSNKDILRLEQGLIQLPWKPRNRWQHKTCLISQEAEKYCSSRVSSYRRPFSHLTLDKNDRVVYVFHHCGFLKENLRVSMDQGSELPAEEYLKRGCIPRQLALEALDTIQGILFPLADAQSKDLISSLVSTSYWDTECEQIPSSSYLTSSEADLNIKYHYFGTRLKDLYDEVSDPRPKTYMGKWLDRKKSARHVMMATLTGVVIAIVLGMLTLGVSGYQAWLG
ncbi:hypothetical protein TWF481_011682 [Arthrobotrys musiformis]|uniref:HNH nuclease domain-containing protein n=1 Tax=Arthrobotrys musiformis TaxID=47236 RepID=A0AAV9W0E4_9PEZI